MKPPWVAFDKSTGGVILMAAFCAELTKQNICFYIKQDSVGYEVHITGY